MIKFIFFPALYLACYLFGAVNAHAHGVVAGYKEVPGIKIAAQYDNGSPLAGGQVTVFAADDPTTPWRRSTLDDQGEFVFVPDHSIVGTWSVQVRQSGHGAMIHIPIVERGVEPQEDAPSGAITPLQKGVIAVCVAWGSIGTALFFSRRKNGKHTAR